MAADELPLGGALIVANETIKAAGQGFPPGVAIAAAVLGTVGVVTLVALLGFVIHSM